MEIYMKLCTVLVSLVLAGGLFVVAIGLFAIGCSTLQDTVILIRECYARRKLKSTK